MLQPPAPTPRMARSWQSCKVPDDWKKANIFMLQKGHGSPESCRMLNHTSDFGRIKGQILLEAITRHVKNKRWLGTTSFGLARAQCDWPSWFFFCYEKMVSVDEGRVVVFTTYRIGMGCSILPVSYRKWDLQIINIDLCHTNRNVSLHRSFQYAVTFLTIFR